MPLDNVDDMVALLGSLNLQSLEPAFRTNGISGSDFADLTDQDMKDDLGMTGIQIKKIRAAVAREMGGVAAAPAAAAVAAAAPVAAAPYVAAAAVAAAPMAAAPMAAAPMMAAPVVAAVVVDREMAMGEVRRYTDGTRVLAQTNEQLRAAMAGLRRVSTVATVNGIGNMEHHRHGMFGGRREEFGRGGIGGIGHEMENVVEMRSFKEAKAHTEAAIQMVEQARQIMPNMPYIDMTQVHKLRGMMGAIIFDHSAVMDAVVRQSAHHSLREVEVMAASVERAQGWAQAELGRANATVAGI